MSENDISFEVNKDGTATFSDSKTLIIEIDLGSPSAPAYSFSNDVNTGMYRASNSDFELWMDSSIDDVYELFFAGKTIKDNSDEYLEVIMRLPGIKKNQLDAIETLEFFRRQLFYEPDEK